MERDKHDELSDLIEVRDALRSEAFARVFWKQLGNKRILAINKLIKDQNSDEQRGWIHALDWTANGALQKIEEQIEVIKSLDE